MIRQHISNINKALKEGIRGEKLQPYYTVAPIRRWGGSRYGIKAEKGKISIDEEA